MEHTTIIAGFSLPSYAVPEISWPQNCRGQKSPPKRGIAPAHISLSQTLIPMLGMQVSPGPPSIAFNSPNGRPPSACFGRGQRTQPQVSTRLSKPLKPSRPGEAAMCHDAASATPSALTYRLSLWQAILRARGFRGGFASWWQSRPVQLVGSPPSLPSGVPDAALACALHEDFRCNYRRFEAWHLKRRAQVIDATYDKSLAQLFQELREPAHEQVDSLTIRRDYAILVVAPEGDQVHLDRPPDLRSFPVAVAFKG